MYYKPGVIPHHAQVDGFTHLERKLLAGQNQWRSRYMKLFLAAIASALLNVFALGALIAVTLF